MPTWEHFGYDMVGVGPWFDIMPLRGHERAGAKRPTSGTVRRNGAGAALKYWKHKSGTPEHIDFRMTTREVWERDYRPYLLELDPERVDLDEMRANKAKLDAGAGVDALWAHVYLGVDAPEHGRRHALPEPAARPGLGPRL